MRSVPGAGRTLLLATAGRRGRHVLRLAGASDWRRALADSASSALVATVGTRWLPNGPTWPWPASSAHDLQLALSDHVDGLVLLGAVLPRQSGRERLSLLGAVEGEPLVVKLGRPDTGIEREVVALRLLERDPLPCISTPRVVAHGLITDGEQAHDDPASVAFIVTTALGLDRQRAAIDEPLRTFEADLAERLSALPRSADTPDAHVPVHGDFTPWNLRRTPRGLALFDWEEAGWGPAGSDIESYRRASAALPRHRLRRRTPNPPTR
jgi:hypothetical protein